jgi:hypothetical protein
LSFGAYLVPVVLLALMELSLVLFLWLFVAAAEPLIMKVLQVRRLQLAL